MTEDGVDGTGAMWARVARDSGWSEEAVERALAACREAYYACLRRIVWQGTWRETAARPAPPQNRLRDLRRSWELPQ